MLEDGLFLFIITLMLPHIFSEFVEFLSILPYYSRRYILLMATILLR